MEVKQLRKEVVNVKTIIGNSGVVANAGVNNTAAVPAGVRNYEVYFFLEHQFNMFRSRNIHTVGNYYTSFQINPMATLLDLAKFEDDMATKPTVRDATVKHFLP